MPTKQAVGQSAVTATSTKQDGGSARHIGAVESDGPLANNVALGDTGEDYGSKMVTNTGGSSSSDPAGVEAAKSGGTAGFAYTPARGERNFLIRGVSSKDGGGGLINKDASNLLASPGSEVQLRGVADTHTGVITQKLGEYADRSFDVLAKSVEATKRINPGLSRGSNAGADSTYWDPKPDAGGSATDATKTLVADSRSVPGELTYMFGGPDPQTDDYKAINARES